MCAPFGGSIGARCSGDNLLGMTVKRISSACLCALILMGCDGGTDNNAGEGAMSAETAEFASAAQHPDARTMQLWSRSCALCHVDGNAGAPRLGHAEEWQPRLAQGREMLLQHTIEGLNSMPPLGYCMACEREDFIAMIDFMIADVVADAEGVQP